MHKQSKVPKVVYTDGETGIRNSGWFGNISMTTV